MSKEQVKPGDLAVIINGLTENIGAVVTVGRRVPEGTKPQYTTVDGHTRMFAEVVKKTFEVTSCGRPLLTHPWGAYYVTRPAPAAYLRPIRNPPGQDETLRWADVPRNDYVDAGFMPLGD